MKKLLRGPLAVVIVLGLSLEAQAFFRNEVLGTWQKECQDLEGDYITSQINVEKKNSKLIWTDTQIAFEDQKCQFAYLRFDRQYVPFISGAKLDLSLLDVTYTPLTAEVVEALNDIAFCGVSNWQLNKRQSILDINCEDVDHYSSGQKIYSIYKTASSLQELFVGLSEDNFDGSTPSKRHLHFESTPYRKLKK